MLHGQKAKRFTRMQIDSCNVKDSFINSSSPEVSRFVGQVCGCLPGVLWGDSLTSLCVNRRLLALTRLLGESRRKSTKHSSQNDSESPSKKAARLRDEGFSGTGPWSWRLGEPHLPIRIDSFRGENKTATQDVKLTMPSLHNCCEQCTAGF